MMDPGIAVDISSSEVLSRVANKLKGERSSMSDLKTAQLWLQYLDMVAILKKFIKAERTGNWMLHLAAVQDTLPFLQQQGTICMPNQHTCICKRCANLTRLILMYTQAS